MTGEFCDYGPFLLVCDGFWGRIQKFKIATPIHFALRPKNLNKLKVIKYSGNKFLFKCSKR